MPGEPPRDQSGERSALEELERLHQAIEQSRRKRREANDAFDSFVRSFERRPAGNAPNVRVQPRTSEPPALSPSGLPPSRAAAPGAIADVRRTTAPEIAGPSPRDSHHLVPPAPAAAAPVAAGPVSEFDAVAVEPAVPPGIHADTDAARPTERAEPVVPAALTAAPAPPRAALRWILAGVIVLVVAVLAWSALRPFDPPEPQPQPAPATEPPRVLPAPGPAASAPSTPATELSTERRVWVRVTVDGERVLERELEAGVRIPLKANERIVIRAGDAGAIRLTIAGKDQGAFGPDGIPVTRTFQVPPASPR